jgi:hypothetical protein
MSKQAQFYSYCWITHSNLLLSVSQAALRFSLSTGNSHFACVA